MPARRVNPNLVKKHRSYTASELAARLGIHRNTVRFWRREGLAALTDGRPILFHGATVRAFLAARNADRKRPCPPGTLYCFRCREARAPALGMVDYVQLRRGSGNLRALCGTCEAIMHRRVRCDAIEVVMPGLAVQLTEAPLRLVEKPKPSLYCDMNQRGST